MRSVIVLALVAGLGLGSSAAAEEVARAADATGKQAKIRQLLELTGSAQIGTQVMSQMLPNLKRMVPQASEGFWTEFEKEIDADALVERIVPIYERHFDESDLDGLIAFYSTPLGQKIIRTMPEIMGESMAVGQQWGAEIAQRALERAQAGGESPQNEE